MDIIAGSFSKKKKKIAGKKYNKKTEDRILIWFYIYMHHYCLVFLCFCYNLGSSTSLDSLGPLKPEWYWKNEDLVNGDRHFI